MKHMSGSVNKVRILFYLKATNFSMIEIRQTAAFVQVCQRCAALSAGMGE